MGAERADELHDKDAVGNGDSSRHDDSHERHDVERRAVAMRNRITPESPGGIASKMMKGSENEANCASG